MKKYLKIIQISLGIIGAICLIIFYGIPTVENWKDAKDLQIKNNLGKYYFDLAKKCETNKIYFQDGFFHHSSDKCCLASVEAMAYKNSKIPNNGCPSGYLKNQLMCGEEGYVWCEKN